MCLVHWYECSIKSVGQFTLFLEIESHWYMWRHNSSSKNIIIIPWTEILSSVPLHTSDISQIYYWKPHRENKSWVLLDIRSARDWIPALGQHVIVICLQVMQRKPSLWIVIMVWEIGVLLMGIKPSRSSQLMVESDPSAFAKGLLGRNNETFIGLPRT